jgi:hypothetical protein
MDTKTHSTDSTNSPQASSVQACQNCKQDFTIEPDDLLFYEKMKVPLPTFCYLCRAQRRFAFRNQRKLFKVKDAFSNENIFSLYPSEANRKVTTQEFWHGDKWDPLDYGRDIDWSKSFLSQILELEKEVPIYNLNVKQMVNSPYSGNATGLKNCYLCFNSSLSENCLYGTAVDYSRDCVDISNVSQCERCYEGFWLHNCYQCYFTTMSVDCRNMWFSRDCLGCSDCFGCVNLRKSSYCIFNKQYSKEEYFNQIEKMKLDTCEGVELARRETYEFWKTQPNKFHQGLKNLNVTGSYISHSKNVKDSYLVKDSENLRYCQNMLVGGNKDCLDVCVWGENTELCYETSVSGENSYNLKFCFNCWPACRESEYCMNMFSSSDCFGCVGMKNAKYCILNKQYSKEEYEELVVKIKKHMDDMPYVDSLGLVYKYGEFFPIEFSPFGYNNTMAQEFFPLQEGVATAKGYIWVPNERGQYTVSRKGSDLPQNIKDVDEGILKEIIECRDCKSAYRIMPDELTFLQKENLPLPQICIECRYERRLDSRLPMDLYTRKCSCNDINTKNIYTNTRVHEHGENPCVNEFQTGFDPKKGEIVYCEQCYLSEVA